MSVPPRQVQFENRNVPEGFMKDLIGIGLSYSDWETRFKQRGYLWNEGMKNKMIHMEMEYFKDEILHRTAEENKAEGLFKCKSNSLSSILKRIQGEEWLKGTPVEKDARLQESRLMGKDAKLRCLQTHVKKWRELALSNVSPATALEATIAQIFDPSTRMSNPNHRVSHSRTVLSPVASDQALLRPVLEYLHPNLYDQVGMSPNPDQSVYYSHHQTQDRNAGSRNQLDCPASHPPLVKPGAFPDGGLAARKLLDTPIHDEMMSTHSLPGQSPSAQPESRQTLEFYLDLPGTDMLDSGSHAVEDGFNLGDWIHMDNAHSTDQGIHSNPVASHEASQPQEPLASASVTMRDDFTHDTQEESRPVTSWSDTEMPDCDGFDVSDNAALKGSNPNQRNRRRNLNSDLQQRNHNPIRVRYVSKLKDELAVKEAELRRRIEQIQKLETEKNAALQEKETAKISEAESRRAKEIAETKFQELQEQIKSSENAVKRISRQLEDTVMADNLQLFQEITIAQAPARNKTADEDRDSSHARYHYTSATNSGASTLTAPNGHGSASRSPSPRSNTLSIHPPASRDRSHSGGSSAGLSDRSTLSVQDTSSRDGGHIRGTMLSETSTAVSFKQLRRKISDKLMGKPTQEQRNKTLPPMPVSRPLTAVPNRETENRQRIPVSRQLTEIQNRDSGYVSQSSPRPSVADKE